MLNENQLNQYVYTDFDREMLKEEISRRRQESQTFVTVKNNHK